MVLSHEYELYTTDHDSYHETAPPVKISNDAVHTGLNSCRVYSLVGVSSVQKRVDFLLFFVVWIIVVILDLLQGDNDDIRRRFVFRNDQLKTPVHD